MATAPRLPFARYTAHPVMPVDPSPLGPRAADPGTGGSARLRHVMGPDARGLHAERAAPTARRDPASPPWRAVQPGPHQARRRSYSGASPPPDCRQVLSLRRPQRHPSYEANAVGHRTRTYCGPPSAGSGALGDPVARSDTRFGATSSGVGKPGWSSRMPPVGGPRLGSELVIGQAYPHARESLVTTARWG
jgi:hypothetical protein